MRIHFVSGLPRSGSTLLEGILRQNPRFHAAISGPLAGLSIALIKYMSGFNELSQCMTDAQRRRILRGVVEAYYADLPPDRIVFDTNRAWCALLPAIAELFPESKVICCVRNPAWVIDSIENHIQRNPFGAAKMFGYEAGGTVYSRVEALTGKDGWVKKAMNGFRQAWFGAFADRLVTVRYESLVSNPAGTIGRLYDAIGEPAFSHNFDHVEYDEPRFDANMGLPGFHRVFGPVKATKRETILPPDLFRQNSESFWDKPDQNPRGVLVL
jgi:sulfotransferase